MPTTHPNYDKELWTYMRLAYAGQRAIKAKRTQILPATHGMIANGAEGTDTTASGYKMYDAFLKRALYPDFVADAVRSAVGALHRKPATVELPDSMKHLIENATPSGESIFDLLRNISFEQCLTGRVGILGDMEEGKSGIVPVIKLYKPETGINWDDTADPESTALLSLVVLDECGQELNYDTLEWEDVESYLVIAKAHKEGGGYRIAKDGRLVVHAKVKEDQLNSLQAIERWEEVHNKGPSLEEIPFVFCNATDMANTPSLPPYLAVAELAISVYLAEADHRQSLHMQGQDTLVRKGHEDPERDQPVGAGAIIDVPSAGDAKFIGNESNGLAEQREQKELDYNRASEKSGQLHNTTSRAESGEALKTRVAAQTVTLAEISIAGAKALETVLRLMAPLFGANRDDISIEPNLDFAEQILDSKTLTDLMQAKDKKLPLSNESIHAYLVAHRLTNLTYEEERALLDAEEKKEMDMMLALMPPAPVAAEPATEETEETEEQ